MNQLNDNAVFASVNLEHNSLTSFSGLLCL